MTEKLLLSIIEIGGYPDFTEIYRQYGYTVHRETNMRKALKFIKIHQPHVIVAEFNFQSDFRDRTSKLESMMAIVQRLPRTQVIVLYDEENRPQLAQLEHHNQFAAKLTFPVENSVMCTTINNLSN